MDELVRQAPAIIQEAAKSPLGLFALMIISLSILGFMFFHASTERTRIAIFVLMFIGVVAFGAATIRITSGTIQLSPKADSPSASTPSPSLDQRNIDGKWIARITEAGNVWTIDFYFDVHDGEVLGMVSYPTGDGKIVDGKLVGDKLSFTTRHTPQFEAEVATTRFRGEVANEMISFTMESSTDLRKFTAVRSSR